MRTNHLRSLLVLGAALVCSSCDGGSTPADDASRPELAGYRVLDGWVLPTEEAEICERALWSCHPLLDRLSRLEEIAAGAAARQETAKDREIAQLKRKLDRTALVLRQLGFSAAEINQIERGNPPDLSKRISRR